MAFLSKGLRVPQLVVLFAVLLSPFSRAEEQKTIEELHPNLAMGALRMAKSATLEEDILLRADEIIIKASDLDAAITKAPAYLREELKANAFFVLEQEATGRILESLARQALSAQGVDVAPLSPKEIIRQFLESLVTQVSVTDSEIETFFRENQSLFSGTPLEQVRDQIRDYLLQDKQENFVDDYIKQLGRKVEIRVSGRWLAEQVAKALDNPLDKSRASGRPTLAVFSAASCCGPDQMLPVVNVVRNSYGENLEIVYIEPRKEQVLAARYGVRSIPTQILFDKTGQEVFRHSGFLNEASITEQLNKLGL